MSQPPTNPAGGKHQDQNPGYWPAWLVSGLALAFLIILYLWLPTTPRIDFTDLIAEASISLIPLVGLFVVQQLRPHPRIYLPMMLGLSLLLLSDVTDALDEVRIQPEILGILVENGFAVLGYSLLILGLVRWLGYNRQILAEIQALNAGLDQRVAERTASLAAEIAERRLAEEALRLSEARLRLATEGADLGIWYWDLTTQTHAWSERCRLHLGLPPGQEPSLEHLYAAVHPDHRVWVADQVQSLLAQGADSRAEFRVLWADGSLHWISAPGRVYRHPDGSPKGMGGITQDITERKQVEQNLRQSERRFRELFEYLPIAYQSLDAAGRWVDANQKMADLLGFAKPEDMIGLRFGDYWEPSIRDRFDANFARLREQHAIAGELALLRRDGTPLTVLLAGQSQCDAQGRFLHTHCILTDISERRAMEDEIRVLNSTLEARVAERTAALEAAHSELEQALARMSQSEARFRLAFENANTGMCLVDLHGRLLQVNDKMSAIFGFSRAELEGMSVNDLAAPADQTISPTYMSQAIQGLADSITFEKRYRHRDGHLIYGQIASSLVRDQQGQPLYFISQVQDVTARREAEDQLRASEQRFRLVVDHALDNIWTMGPDHRLRLLSPSIQSLVGYSVEEYLGMTLEQMLMPDSLAVAQAYFTRLDERQAAGLTLVDFPFRGEIELRAKDGSGVWTEIIVTPLVDGEGRLLEFAGVTRDIRERKRYEAQLEQARQAAETANRAKSEFLAHMSHEIRTPLNGVLGLAQVLSHEPLNMNQQDFVGDIQAAGQSLLGIINDVLDFSKIEAGQLRLETRPFHLSGALARVKSLMDPTAQAKGIQLSIATPEPLGPLLGDELRLEQVLLNLIGNAIKFTERGEVTLSPKLLASSATAVRLRFEVQDTGIGIAPPALAGLFEPFTQAEMGISRRFGGTGLGLSICKRLVELMDGAIGVESQVGRGSTFWFELPLMRAEMGESESPPLAAPKRPTCPRLTGVRVLAVDDSAVNRKVVEAILGREGVSLTLAADGQQAVQLLKTRPEAFDVVLMDVQMPIMDGLTATRLLRQELGLTTLPIIALTAGVMAEEQQAAREAGMNGLVPKPIDLEQLVAELQKWLPSPGPSLADG